MEKVLQIVFGLLPLLIIVYSYQIFTNEDDKKTKLKKLLIRVFAILLLIVLNFQFGEQFGIKKDVALISTLFSAAFFCVLFFLLTTIVSLPAKYKMKQILSGKYCPAKIDKVDNFGFTINGKNGKDFCEWRNVKSIKTKVSFEKFNDFKIKSLAFERDENWKPLVDKQQVLKYSRENYW
jgi:hypothetical protein